MNTKADSHKETIDDLCAMSTFVGQTVRYHRATSLRHLRPRYLCRTMPKRVAVDRCLSADPAPKRDARRNSRIVPIMCMGLAFGDGMWPHLVRDMWRKR